MKKKCILGIILFWGTLSAASATDQIFFELNAGVWFYAGLGGKIGWIHYWNNEKIGFIGDISYYNNGFVDEHEADWRETIKIAHNFGIAAGVIFNNMGMKGIIRTSEYIKLKGLFSVWDRPSFVPKLDAGFNLNVFFTDKYSLLLGLGMEIPILYPSVSLGMTFTL